MVKFNFPGDIHFLTFRTFQSYPYFKDEKCCQLFLDNLNFYRSKYDLEIYGYAILNNHTHLLLSYESDKFPELTISKIVQVIKGASARYIINHLKQPGTQEPPLLARNAQLEQRLQTTRGKITQPGTQEPLLLARNTHLEQRLQTTRGDLVKGHKRGLKYGIWQPSFYDFNIYSPQKFEQKLNYIHKNPIKHGLIDDISLYKYCSWRNYEMADQSIFKIDYLQS